MVARGVPPHPAPFSDALLPIFAEVLGRRRSPVLDPFAGIGRVHELHALTGCTTVGVELEPRWAASHRRTLQGDATDLPRVWSRKFAAVVTSPCYGNRMADHHDAADVCSECRGTVGTWEWRTRAGWTDTCPKCKGSGLSPRRTYRHYLGQPLRSGSSAAMQWGIDYRELHERAWREVHRVLRHRGLFVLNIKNHVRDGRVVRVAEWHRRTIEGMGFDHVRTIRVPGARGFRFGQNHDARTPERVYVFRRP